MGSNCFSRELASTTTGLKSMNLHCKGIAVIIAVLTLGGCGSSGPIGPLPTASGEPTADIQVIRLGELPEPTHADYVAGYREYRIGPFDMLEIGVFGIDELERAEYRADGTGRISFPLLGTIDAGGMTPAQLEQEIAGGLRGQFIRDPKVTVNLKEPISRMVTVTGQVAKPGAYPVLGETTLVRAVASAGGMSEFAKTSEVLIFRTVNGQRMAGLYDLGAIQRGNYADPEVYASDVVVVGDSPQKRLIRDIVGTAPVILAPLLVTLLRNN